MKVPHKRIQIGSRVRLTKPVVMFDATYTVGHEFKVIDLGERGWDLEDDDGNKILETRLIGDSFELVD